MKNAFLLFSLWALYFTTNGNRVHAANNEINYQGSKKSSSAINNVASDQSNMIVVIPVFRTALKFDNNGAGLSSPQFAIHGSGGLISATAGSIAEGYLKLPEEVEGRKTTRTDWLLSWNAGETNASISVGLGEASSGYKVTIANSGGNVVVTFPSGTVVSSPLSGVVNMNVSLATGNMGITASVHLLGTPTALSTGNAYRVPVSEYTLCTKTRLWNAYFRTNTSSSRIVGFLHNGRSWDGDPDGQLLTRTMLLHASGYPGWNGANRDESMIILPERSQPGQPLKITHFFHSATSTYNSILTLSFADAGETARQLLAGGYALIAINGGSKQINRETDWWGNPTGLAKADELYKEVVKNVSNTGKEYLLGFSMGGVCSANYLKLFGSRVGAVWLSCPALDLEETASNGIQQNTSLKNGLDLAYMSWYMATASTTSDPQQDANNWRRLSAPGGLPPVGATNFAVATVISVVNNNTIVPTSDASRFYPGDQIYFKYSGQSRRVVFQATGNSNVVLDAPVTLVVGDQITLIRPDGRVSYDWDWQNRPLSEWRSGSTTAGLYALRKSPRPELDVRPHNPIRFADYFAQINVPFHIMVGGNGTASGSDAILNNAPMFAFRDAVNAFQPGLVTILAGSGMHLAATTMNASDVKALYDAN